MVHMISASDTVETIEIVEFTIGNKTLGVQIDSVQEIIHSLSITAIPLAHPFIKGMAALRGDGLIVLNLERILEEKSQFNSKQEKMIVIHCQNHKLAVHVEQVTEIKRIHVKDFKKSQAPYFNYEIETGQGLLYMVDTEEILHVIQGH